MRRARPASLALIIIVCGGCATRGPTPEGAPQAGSPAAGLPVETKALADDVSIAPRRSNRPSPEDDPRYALPRGDKRFLTIFLGSQTFEYVEDGRVITSGEISSGTAAHPTPTGSFRVQSKDRNKRSGSYTNYFDQNTPMPYSLQFYGPYFIHEGWIPGYPDSHGCVRLHYEDARFLFDRMRVGDRVVVAASGSARSESPWGGVFPVF